MGNFNDFNFVTLMCCFPLIQGGNRGIVAAVDTILCRLTVYQKRDVKKRRAGKVKKGKKKEEMKEEGSIRCIKFLPRCFLNLLFLCWQKAQVLHCRQRHLWFGAWTSDSSRAEPTVPWVFLVRCVDCSDRGHSFGREPLGMSVISRQHVPKNPL